MNATKRSKSKNIFYTYLFLFVAKISAQQDSITFEIALDSTFDNQEKPCAVFGILRGTGDILEWCKQVKLDWYYFDHAYFGGNRHGKGLVDDKVYRITKNNSHIQDILSREKINYKRIENYFHL